MKSWKKGISITLAIMLIVAGMPVQTKSAASAERKVTEQVQSKKEVPEGYTPIYTINDLAGINSNPSGKYILMNDVDMTKETSPGGTWDTGHGWTPLDTFSGTLDGNGYRIIGMHIYGEFKNYNGFGIENVGLFSKIEDGIVQNLGIVDCNINVTCIGFDGDDFFGVGGIAGVANAEISGCYVTGEIQDLGRYAVAAGGIVGDFIGNIKNCYNTAKISGIDQWRSGLGGIAGSSSGKVINCYNIGDLNKLNYKDVYEDEYEDDYEDEYGDEYTIKIGGIVGGAFRAGWGSQSSDLESCYYLNTTATQGDGGGNRSDSTCKALTDAQMRYISSFTGFDSRIWALDELSSYPYPQLKACPQVRVEKMELKSLPDKLIYAQGDKLDLSGSVLSIIYEDGVVTSTALAKSMVSGADMNRQGNQTLTVNYLNASCTFDIEVQGVEASSITLSKKNITLNRNAKVQLSAVIKPSNTTDQSVQWESDNELIASVSKNGIVRGINPGITTITATTNNGLSASCTVTVKIPAKSITLNKSKFTLKKGRTKKLKATVNPLETTDTVRWSTSNARVATVSQSGVVKAKKKGFATIMAKTSNGKKAYAKVKVK